MNEWWAVKVGGGGGSGSSEVPWWAVFYGGVRFFFRLLKNSDNCDKEILSLARDLRPPVSGTTWAPIMIHPQWPVQSDVREYSC